jgi:hypothetical protein
VMMTRGEPRLPTLFDAFQNVPLCLCYRSTGLD